MVVMYLSIGIAVGAIAAVKVYLAGYSLWLVVLAYSLGGSAAIMLAALVIFAIITFWPQVPETDSRSPSLSR